MDLEESKRIIAAARQAHGVVVGMRARGLGLSDDAYGAALDEWEADDAALIAHARTALPELVAEVERLRQALEDVPCEHQREGYLKAMRRAEAAEATVERVREAVKEVDGWRDLDLVGTYAPQLRDDITEKIDAALGPR